jgi:ParB family chromosome partitioning protein
LQTEQEEIESAHAEAEEYPPDVDQRMAEIDSRIEELNDQPRKYRDEEIPLAGAIVALRKPRSSRGVSRPRSPNKHNVTLDIKYL